MADLLRRCRKVRAEPAQSRGCRRSRARLLRSQKGEDQQKLAGEIMTRVADSLEKLRLAQDSA